MNRVGLLERGSRGETFRSQAESFLVGQSTGRQMGLLMDGNWTGTALKCICTLSSAHHSQRAILPPGLLAAYQCWGPSKAFTCLCACHAPLCPRLQGHLAELSLQKFSSNVVEKCLKLSGVDAEKEAVVGIRLAALSCPLGAVEIE